MMYHLEIPWSQFYVKLREYGSLFINNDLVDSLCKDIYDDHGIMHRSMGSEIPEWIRNEFSIVPEILQIFAAKPGGCGMTHMDGLDRNCALNIPVRGCSHGKIQWFDEEYPIKTINNKYTRVRLTGQETLDFRFNDTPVYEFTLTSPSLLNTNAWHRVNNRDNEDYRYVLSLRFSGNPSFDDVSDMLSR